MAVNFAKLKPRALPLRCGNSVDRMKSRRAAGTANLRLMTQPGRRAAWKATGRQPANDFSAAPKIVIIRIKFSVHPGSPGLNCQASRLKCSDDIQWENVT